MGDLLNVGKGPRRVLPQGSRPVKLRQAWVVGQFRNEVSTTGGSGWVFGLSICDCRLSIGFIAIHNPKSPIDNQQSLGPPATAGGTDLTPKLTGGTDVMPTEPVTR